VPLVEGFKRIFSVDVVAEPAAGGRFERLLAAQQDRRFEAMDPEQLKELIKQVLAEMGITGPATPAPAPPSPAMEAVEDPDATPDAPPDETIPGESNPVAQVAGMAAQAVAQAAADAAQQVVSNPPETVSQAVAQTTDAITTAAEQAAKALQESTDQRVRRLECAILLRDRLDAAKLPPEIRKIVEAGFSGKIFQEADLNTVLSRAKEAQAATDRSGQVVGAGSPRSTVKVGLSDRDRAEIEFQRLMMGAAALRALEANKTPYVQERLTEANRAFFRDGNRASFGIPSMSFWMHEFINNPFTHVQARAMESLGTADLATIVKNTVNIMLAADYSVKQEWWDALVRTEEVDTLDDVTLARIFGMSTLPVVEEKQPYTEGSWDDEEETATFAKRGDFVGIAWESLYRDKLNAIRTIPQRLSNAWYNTLSALVAGVFTVNSAAGPVLTDTGALFNATAATSAGGHANLLTAALSFTAFGAARVAMMKQTDQPLGVGARLGVRNEPRFLLVPVDLETTALQIRNSEMLPGSANNDVNPYYQKFDVVVVPEWTDTNNWALLADPAQVPALYQIFLRGNRVPTLFTADDETAGAMFTNDTIRYKVRMAAFRFSATYDCAPVADFRGIHKSNVS